MRTIIRSFFIFILLFFYTSYINAQDWNKVRQSIEDMNKKIEKAVVADDFEQIASFYCSDVISLADYEPEIKGLDKVIEKSKKDKADGFKYNSMRLKTTEVYGSGNLAVEIGEWEVGFQLPGYNKKFKDQGKYVTIWQEQPDKTWKIKTETWNTNTFPVRESSGEAEISEVKKVVDGFSKTIETKDLSMFEKITAHDDDMVNFGTDAAEHWVGYEPLKVAVKKQFESFGDTKLKVRDQVIKVNKSGNTAWFSEITDWNITTGGQKVELKDSRFTGVLEKRDGKWVIVQFHASVPVPGQAAEY